MKDENQKYEALDARFQTAAANIPVEFDQMAWESLSYQLDQTMGTSHSRWSDLLGNIKLNLLIGLVIDFLVLSGIMVVFVSSLSSTVPTTKENNIMPKESNQLTPAVDQEDGDQEELNILNSEKMDSVEKSPVKESKVYTIEIVNDSIPTAITDSLEVKQDSLIQDSLNDQFIFWY